MTIAEQFRARINTDRAVITEVDAVLDEDTYEYALGILRKIDALQAVDIGAPTDSISRHGRVVRKVQVC
jgi:hypothetical protein